MSYRKKIFANLVVCSLFMLGFAYWTTLRGIGQDMSVEMLLNNLKTGQFSGKPIDLDLEEVDIKTLFSYIEKSSGLTFQLSPDIPLQSLEKATYKHHQVPWDQILYLLLKEYNLEIVPKDGNVYVQPTNDKMIRIIREDQVQVLKSNRIPLLFYFLAGFTMVGVVGGYLLYRKRIKVRKTSSGGFVIDSDRADDIMKKVTYLFDVEKVFRKEDISLQSLSEELSIPSYQLSWIINKKMKITFSGLVNSYRVKEAQKRLISSEDADKTILDIAFEAGFNTKTSFNRVFKKHTRMTPSQYRKRYKVHF